MCTLEYWYRSQWKLLWILYGNTKLWKIYWIIFKNRKSQYQIIHVWNQFSSWYSSWYSFDCNFISWLQSKSNRWNRFEFKFYSELLSTIFSETEKCKNKLQHNFFKWNLIWTCQSDSLEPIFDIEYVKQLIKEAVSRVFSGVNAILDYKIMCEFQTFNLWVVGRYE